MSVMSRVKGGSHLSTWWNSPLGWMLGFLLCPKVPVKGNKLVYTCSTGCSAIMEIMKELQVLPCTVKEAF